MSSKIVHQNPWYSVREDEVTRPDGKPGTYFVTQMPHPGALVVPYDGERLYLVKQYRYAIEQDIWAFPAGHSNSDNQLEDAQRELQEETGFTAEHWQNLGTVALAPGWSSAQIICYLATGLTKQTELREETESDMVMQGFTPTELINLIKTTNLYDALLLNVLPLLEIKGGIHILNTNT